MTPRVDLTNDAKLYWEVRNLKKKAKKEKRIKNPKPKILEVDTIEIKERKPKVAERIKFNLELSLNDDINPEGLKREKSYLRQTVSSKNRKSVTMQSKSRESK